MLEVTARFLLDPFHILLFLFAGVVIFWVLNYKKWYKAFYLCSIVWFLICSTPLVPVFLVHSLETKFIPLNTSEFQVSDDEIHIVVLGAGYTYDSKLPPNSQLNRTTLGRLVEGVRIYKALSNSKLVTSGPYNNRTVSQAEVAKQTAIMLGVAEEDILIQAKPTNTFEEAKEYFESHYTGNNEIVLVTSSIHMRRAVLAFTHFGLDVNPSPTNFQLTGRNKWHFIGMPSTININLMKVAISEYAAIVREYFRTVK